MGSNPIGLTNCVKLSDDRFRWITPAGFHADRLRTAEALFRESAFRFDQRPGNGHPKRSGRAACGGAKPMIRAREVKQDRNPARIAITARDAKPLISRNGEYQGNRPRPPAFQMPFASPKFTRSERLCTDARDQMPRSSPGRKTHSVSATVGDQTDEQPVALCQAEDTAPSS